MYKIIVKTIKKIVTSFKYKILKSLLKIKKLNKIIKNIMKGVLSPVNKIDKNINEIRITVKILFFLKKKYIKPKIPK